MRSGAKCNKAWWNNVCIRFGNPENVVSGSRLCNPILIWKTGAEVKWITSSRIAKHGILKFWSRLNVLKNWAQLFFSCISKTTAIYRLQCLNQLITTTLLFVQTNKQKTDHSHHLLNQTFFFVLKSNIYNIHNAPVHTMKADNGQAAKSSKEWFYYHSYSKKLH